MKIVVISGSSRTASQSHKVGKWLEQKLQEKDIETGFIDLNKLCLPLCHEDVWETIDSDKVAIELRKSLEESDGFIVITPEWNGMANPALKNMFIYVKKTMAHKPALIVAVSGGRGGAYPVAELRMSSSKNSFVNYIPEHLIVRNAPNVMNDQELSNGEKEDIYIKHRAIHCLDLLIEYTKAMKELRHSPTLDYDTYPTGM